MILWGDHGWHLGEHNFWAKNNLLHNAMRCPLIIRAPGFGMNTETDGIVELVDIFPTLCELAGIEAPRHLQGISMVPLMRDPSRPGKQAALIRDTRGAAVTTRNHVYAEYPNGDRMLFDHTTDPAENVNVAGKPNYADIVTRMAEILSKRESSLSGRPQRSASPR